MFLLGSIDPWHFLSVLKSDVSLNETAVFINGTAHCADMASDRSTDPQSLKDARLVSPFLNCLFIIFILYVYFADFRHTKHLNYYP